MSIVVPIAGRGWRSIHRFGSCGDAVAASPVAGRIDERARLVTEPDNQVGTPIHGSDVDVSLDEHRATE